MTLTIFIFYMRKLILREMNELTPGHTTSKHQSRDLDPNLTSEDVTVVTLLS